MPVCLPLWRPRPVPAPVGAWLAMSAGCKWGDAQRRRSCAAGRDNAMRGSIPSSSPHHLAHLSYAHRWCSRAREHPSHRARSRRAPRPATAILPPNAAIDRPTPRGRQLGRLLTLASTLPSQERRPSHLAFLDCTLPCIPIRTPVPFAPTLFLPSPATLSPSFRHGRRLPPPRRALWPGPCAACRPVRAVSLPLPFDPAG